MVQTSVISPALPPIPSFIERDHNTEYSERREDSFLRRALTLCRGAFGSSGIFAFSLQSYLWISVYKVCHLRSSCSLLVYMISLMHPRTKFYFSHDFRMTSTILSGFISTLIYNSNLLCLSCHASHTKIVSCRRPSVDHNTRFFYLPKCFHQLYDGNCEGQRQRMVGRYIIVH